MAKDLNMVQFTGRLGKDPEAKYTPAGALVVKLVAASNRTWVDKATGEKREATEWFNCEAWGKLAEICTQYLAKGSRIYGEGRLQTHSWEDSTSGQRRYMTQVILNDMIMLDSAAESRGSRATQPAADDSFEDEEQEDRLHRPSSRTVVRTQPAHAQAQTPIKPTGKQATRRAPATVPLVPASGNPDDNILF